MIYFIQAGSDGPIKIGRTDYDITIRMQSLQASSLEPLHLIAACHGGSTKEAELHRKFKDAHVHGEWFKPLPDLLGYINNLEHKTQDGFDLEGLQRKVRPKPPNIRIGESANCSDKGSEILARLRSGEIMPLHYCHRRIGVLVPFPHQKMSMSLEELRETISVLAEMLGLKVRTLS